MHGCEGTAQKYFKKNTKHRSLADTYGFITIYPSAANYQNCWDVHTNESLSHNGGSDSLSIVSMVRYAITQYNADLDKVFVMGESSGAMMTNVLSAAYPDVFAAGSAYSGLPAGCLRGSPGSGPKDADRTCPHGQMIKTTEEWGDIARSFYPGYTGEYPRMLIWHGTLDGALNPQNFVETLKQWSNLHDVRFSKNVTNTPERGYTKMVYGDGERLVGYEAHGVGHPVPLHEMIDLEWFGII